MNTINRWANNWRLIIKDVLSSMGFLWLVTEVVEYFFSNIAQQLNLKSYGLIFFIISLMYGILKNFPKNVYKEKIRDRDSFVELKIGDAFNNKGALIVPINSELDVSLGGNVNKAKSIQHKLITDYYDSKEIHLKNDISSKIDLLNKPFPAGTVVEIEQKNKRFYLLVNTVKNNNNRVNSSLDDFINALNGIWDFLSKDSSRDEAVTIPLICTQHGRNADLTRSAVIKQIIDTFIDTTKYKSVCEKLIISIQPSDIAQGELDFEQLKEYLKFQCLNYKDIKFNTKPEGKGIEASVISTIKS